MEGKVPRLIHDSILPHDLGSLGHEAAQNRCRLQAGSRVA